MYKLGIVGCGNMAESILKGVIKSKLYNSKDIIVTHPRNERLDYLKKTYSVDISPDNNDALFSKMVLLGVKPQMINSVAQKFNKNTESLFISILAGISVDTLSKLLPAKSRIIRSMPNTPAAIGAGITLICNSESASKEDVLAAKNLFKSVGEVAEVEEKYFNAAMAISGCGPAYFYLILEALSDAGVKFGLKRDVALKLAAQTALGSAQMLLQTNAHPTHLKDMVTSPGGTTIAALYELEKHGLRTAFIDTVAAAVKRAEEM